MKVLYLNSTAEMGGAESSLLTLLAAVRHLHPEWQLCLILGGDGLLARSAAALNVEVHVLALPTALAHFGTATGIRLPSLYKALSALFAARAYRSKLGAAIRNFHPEVLHVSGFKMTFLVASLGRLDHAGGGQVRLCHIHDFVSRQSMKRWLMILVASRFDRLVANSESVAADLMLRVQRKRIVSIHNGVDTNRFSPEGERIDLDHLSGMKPSSNAIKIGIVSTFAYWKGHATFFQALELLPKELNVRCYVVGGPIYLTPGSQYTMESLRMAARQLCPTRKIGFTGMVADVDSVYRALDIVVHASTEPEPFGMVIVEAMSSGRAVVVSRGGGASEIFEDEMTALAHDPGDIATLVHQIERLSSDASLRQRLGENARAVVLTRFSASRMAEQFDVLYQQLLAERGLPA